MVCILVWLIASNQLLFVSPFFSPPVWLWLLPWRPSAGWHTRRHPWSLDCEVMWCAWETSSQAQTESDRIWEETDRGRIPGECVTADWSLIWLKPGTTCTHTHTHYLKVNRIKSKSASLLCLQLQFFSMGLSQLFTYQRDSCPRA